MLNTDEQKCQGCSTVKPFSDFHKDASKPTGYRVKCKLCVKEYGAARYRANAQEHRDWRKGYYEANREKVLAQARRYAAENAEKISVKARERREANPEVARWAGILHRWGITREQYEALWLAQGERCPICLSAESTNLHVDHDHDCCSGRKACGNCVRGIVCAGCNLLLGHAKDSTERLAGAIRYLTAYNARTWYKEGRLSLINTATCSDV